MAAEMVKGATKRIVEIKETGSDCFERAIFFINAQGSRGKSEYTLSQEARRIIDGLADEKSISSGKKSGTVKTRFLSVLKVLASACVGVVLTLLFTHALG